MSNFDVTKFLESYQQHPCLYDKSLPEYKDRERRNQAEDELLKISRLGSIKELRSKVRSIRGAYNNEYRKVKNSMITGSGSDQLYKPKLKWYNYAHTFLRKNTDHEPESETNLNLNNGELSEEVHIMKDTDNETSMTSEISPSTTQHKIISTHRTIVQDIKSNKSKPKETLREALDTLKDIRHHVQDNEFTLFGQQVGIQLNNLPLRKALEMQQKIQNLLYEARLENLNYKSSSLNCSTPIPSIDRSTISSMCDNFDSNHFDVHFYGNRSKSFDTNSVHNSYDRNKIDDCDANVQESHNTEEVLTTYYSSWNDQSEDA